MIICARDFIYVLLILGKFCTVISSVKPNVLIFVIDDLRPSLGVYGDLNAKTPNIDKFSRKSFVFSNAFAQQALCAPSRNSFLTSRRPDSLHLYDFYSYWRNTVGNFTTLPQHFKENGYQTYSIGKVFHPGKSSNFSDDYPYSWSTKAFHPRTEIYKNAKVCINYESGEKAMDLLCPVILDEQPLQTLPDIESKNEAVRFIKNYKNMNGGLPYLLMLGFHKPHIPLKFPRRYLDLHDINKVVMPSNIDKPSLLPNVAFNPWNDLRLRTDVDALGLSYPFGPMPLNFTRAVIQHYAAATSYMDDLFQEVLEVVDNNTVIVLLGDHGVSMGEHGEFSKYSNYEVSTRVPFIIYDPKLNLNKKFTTLKRYAELVDLFPTLVEITNVSKKLDVCKIDKSNEKLCTEGRSLYSYMKNAGHKVNITFIENQNAEAVFMQYPRPGLYPTKHPDSDKPKLSEIKIMGYSIRTNLFRYTEWVGFNKSNCKPIWSRIYGIELYGIAFDPDENNNIAGRKEVQDIEVDLSRKLHLGWRYYIDK